MHPNYRPDIDGLRAVAVLAVVVFHAFPHRMSGGFIGVDVFFVISGYLISTIILENLDRASFRFTEFYARRITRIFPALFLVLLASLALGWFALLTDEYTQLAKHVAAGAGFVSNLVLWNESGYFDTTAETKPLLHLWSLGLEEQFYILWPLLLWAARKWMRHVLAAMVAVAVVSFALNLHGVHRDAVATFYSPQTRFWELACGSILAWCMLYRQPLVRRYTDRWAHAMAFSGALLLGYGFWHIHSSDPFPGILAVIPVLGAVLIIAAGSAAWVNRVILSHPAMVWIGLISFPLYLWHWPLLSFARIVEGETPDRMIRIAAVLLSFALAGITYRYVERPIRQGRNTHVQSIDDFRAGSVDSLPLAGRVGRGTSKLASSLTSRPSLTLRPPRGRGRPSKFHRSNANCYKRYKKAVILLLLMSSVGFIGYDAFIHHRVPHGAARVASSFQQLDWTLPAGSPEQIARCHALFPERQQMTPRERDDNFCMLAKDAAPNVVLIGDSMNLSLFPGLSTVDGINPLVLSASAAAPLYNIRTTESNDTIRQFHYKLTNQALDYAIRTDSVSVVILSFFNGPLLTNPADMFKITNVLNPSDTDARRVFTSALSATLTRLEAAKKHVIFVLPNPRLPFDIKRCLNDYRPLRITAKKDTACVASSRDYLDRGGREYRQWVASVVKDFPHVTVFDLAAPLCDATHCQVVRDGKVLYRDYGHLSIDGSTFVSQSLAPIVHNALESP